MESSRTQHNSQRSQFIRAWLGVMVKFLVSLGVLSAQDGESIHRLYMLVDAFYPSHLSRELPFKRFNAERFLALPTSKSSKRICPDQTSQSNPANPPPASQLNEEVTDFIEGLIHEVENDDSELNSSIAEITLDDDENEGTGEDVDDNSDDEYCHVGEVFDLNFDPDGAEFEPRTDLVEFNEL